LKIFVPPIKCQGIKTKLVEWIAEQVELHENGQWIEPFTGSGVVGFNVRPRRALFCDINPHIINFYNALKSGVITAANATVFLKHEGELLSRKGEEHFYDVRARFNKEGDPLDFLFLSRASFNGVIRFNKKSLYNVPFGHKHQRFSKAYITKISNQIKYVTNVLSQYDWSFICTDFRSSIRQSSSKDFVYCDPPYAGRHTDYFNSWSDADEQELYDLLSSTSARFMLSTWHSNKYRTNAALEKYTSCFKVLTREHFYYVGASEENRNPLLEAIVLNYTPAASTERSGRRFEETIQLRPLKSATPDTIPGQ